MAEQPPTIATLILDHGVKINSHPCSACGRWTLYRIDGDDTQPAAPFFVCVNCDTTSDARRDAEAKARQHG